MFNKRNLGNFYENKVIDYLKKNKYEILEKNYYIREGEVDIIAKEKDTLVFIEVKAREEKSKISPFEAVDIKKQKRIIKAAKDFLLKNNFFNSFIRFDVVGVITSENKIKKIEIIKDAFQDDV